MIQEVYSRTDAEESENFAVAVTNTISTCKNYIAINLVEKRVLNDYHSLNRIT